MSNVFGDDDPINILLDELDRSNDFFKILSKTFESDLKDSAKKSIKNVKEMKKYVKKASYKDLKKMIIEVRKLQKMN